MRSSNRRRSSIPWIERKIHVGGLPATAEGSSWGKRKDGRVKYNGNNLVELLWSDDVQQGFLVCHQSVHECGRVVMPLAAHDKVLHFALHGCVEVVVIKPLFVGPETGA
jgi:hypothetical protein